MSSPLAKASWEVLVLAHHLLVCQLRLTFQWTVSRVKAPRIMAGAANNRRSVVPWHPSQSVNQNLQTQIWTQSNSLTQQVLGKAENLQDSIQLQRLSSLFSVRTAKSGLIHWWSVINNSHLLYYFVSKYLSTTTN